MIDLPKLSIVIAVEHAQQNIPAILEKINLNYHPAVELLICYTDADANVPALVGDHKNIRLLHNKVGCRIPHLWRDGIRAALSDRVAITTAHCIPAEDWVDRLLTLKLPEKIVGAGGVIENQSDAKPVDWAIFFMRYINYAPPKLRIRTYDIAADNALYVRQSIMEHNDLLESGFWEPSFHTQFKNAGKSLQIEPELCVFHHNAYTGNQFFLQRFVHGKAFGSARASSQSIFKRLLLIVLSPILPIIFLRKIIKSVLQNGRYTSHLVSALPWLFLFIAGWGSGEAMGYLTSLKQKK
jgi:hypothetical protein